MQEHFGALQREKDEQQLLEDKLAAMQAKVRVKGTLYMVLGSELGCRVQGLGFGFG